MDFKLEGKTVVVVGGGLEGCRKTQNFVDSGAQITVVSDEFSECTKSLAEQGKIRLHKVIIKDPQAFIDRLNPKPDLLLAITNNSDLNSQLVKAAKAKCCIVYSVDNPALSDFILPAVAKVGDVKIAISTGGKSPAMARELRQRIEKLVTPEDLLEIELQEYMRGVLKTRLPDQRERARFLNEILNNVDIKQALKDGNLCAAKELAAKLLKNKEAKA
jgi:precorrin-2 dehydrogenase / sirohydrochlorin ferrochelatase